MPPIFKHDASIILLGMRGVGKSTLASIASRALGWSFVDEKSFFEASTGLSMSGYIDRHGLASYRRRQLEVLISLLREKSHCHVIECTSGCIQTADGRSMLGESCIRHPVIHVTRDFESVEMFLRNRWNGDISTVRFEQEPLFDSCSNLTFYNLDTAKFRPESFTESDPLHPRPTSSAHGLLSFKCVEHDFVRFLKHLGYASDGPIASTATRPRSGPEWMESQPLTYMLPITMKTISDHYADLAALETCIDCFQFCIDIRGTGNTPSKEDVSWHYALLRRMTNTPIALFVQVSAEDLRADTRVERAYFNLLSLGVKLGFEYIFVDLKTAQPDRLEALVAHKGQTRLVGYRFTHFAGDGWLGKERVEACRMARRLGFDAVQVTQPGTAKEDNAAAAAFATRMESVGDASFTVSAFNTGLLGRQSQCFNNFMTPVRTIAVESHSGLWDSDLLTPQDIEKALFSSFALAALDFYTVGTDVTYSVAPAVTNASFAAYNMPHVYHRVSTSSVTKVLDLAEDPRFGGAGLSSPFKMDIVGALQSVSRDAQIIGAVNTILPIRSWTSPDKFILREQRGRSGGVLGLHGENTDWLGMKNCILHHLSPANAITPKTTALVIGAGGMSRAAVYAAIQCGVQSILIWNRTRSHAWAVAEHFRRNVDEFHPLVPTFDVFESLSEPWPRDHKQPTIVIDCLPYPIESLDSLTTTSPDLETAADTQFKIPDRWMRSPNGGVYLQLAYNTPLPSPVMCQIALKGYRGWVGVSGLEIFLEVAMAQFEYWCGRRAPRSIMRTALLKEVEASTQQNARTAL